MLPVASRVTPGISLLPRVRGPIPERNRKLPTRLACGNAPTGSGARELSKVLFISFSNRGLPGCTQLRELAGLTRWCHLCFFYASARLQSNQSFRFHFGRNFCARHGITSAVKI